MFGWFKKKTKTPKLPLTVGEVQRRNYHEHALREERRRAQAVKTEDLGPETIALIAASTMSDSSSTYSEPETRPYEGGGGDYGGGGSSGDYGSSSDSSSSCDSGSSGGGGGGCD